MKRLAKLWKIIEKNNADIDSIFLPNSPDENFGYMTGLEGGFEGCFAILRKRKIDVFVNELEYEGAKKYVANPKIVHKRSERLEIIKNAATGSKIGVVADKLSYASAKRLEYLGIKLVDVSKFFDECRMIKDNDEIKKIDRAVEITKNALETIETLPSNESELAAKIEYEFRKSGCTTAFPTICAADKNSAVPHYSTGFDRINGMVLVDFGARFQGYCADITRCIFKKRTAWFGETEKKVLKAHDKCVDIARNSGTGFEMQKSAQAILGKRFMHSIGHFLGRDVHENSLSNFKKPFEPGMVFTIEPGLYDIRHGGIRIENDFLVTKNGVKEF
ncbi:MAG: Xaa-Pro peptidase family protein [Candidatus Aenigmatarchaeota archaeon]